MKTLIITILAITISNSAFATSFRPEIFSEKALRVDARDFIVATKFAKESKVLAKKIELPNWEIDVDSNWRELDIISASLELMPVANKLRLSVIVHPKCLMDFCPAVLDEKIVALPITSKVIDACGVITYKALKDDRPVDGVKEELTLIDYSATSCRYLAPVTTSVHYELSFFDRLNQMPVVINNYFTAAF